MPCVAVCCSVMPCVAVCCSVLQCVAVWCRVCCSVLQSVAECCSVSQLPQAELYCCVQANTLCFPFPFFLFFSTMNATQCKILPLFSLVSQPLWRFNQIKWYTAFKCSMLQYVAVCSLTHCVFFFVFAPFFFSFFRSHYDTLTMAGISFSKTITGMCVCVCVCVCEREGVCVCIGRVLEWLTMTVSTEFVFILACRTKSFLE